MRIFRNIIKSIKFTGNTLNQKYTILRRGIAKKIDILFMRATISHKRALSYLSWITIIIQVTQAGIVIILIYAGYSVWQEFQANGYQSPVMLSLVSLFLSAFTLWRTFLVPADVRIALTNHMRTRSSEEELILLFHNRGNVRAYVDITEMICGVDTVEVVPRFQKPFFLESRSQERISFRLCHNEDGTLPHECFPLQLEVSYLFWRGVNPISRHRYIAITLAK